MTLGKLIQQPRIFLLTKWGRCKLYGGSPSWPQDGRREHAWGNVPSKGFCKCQKYLIRKFSWMHIRRLHRILSIYLSFFLRLALVDFYSLWDPGANSSRGRCSPVCCEAARDSNRALCALGKKHFIKYLLHTRVCIILHLSSSTLY